MSEIAVLHDVDTASILVEVASLEWGDMALIQPSEDGEKHHVYITPVQLDFLRKVLSVYP